MFLVKNIQLSNHFK